MGTQVDLIRIFGTIPDPRRTHGQRHDLVDVLTIATLAVICGAEHWTEVEKFGASKREWLETFLKLPHGIPSHDTFGRVFAAISPRAFQAAFAELLVEVRQRVASAPEAAPAPTRPTRERVSIDGKVSRGSGVGGCKALRTVSAWADEARLVLGQREVDGASNETATIPMLLEMLDLRETVVTIDAAGTTPAIAEAIVEGGGDYVLAVKKNQPTLYAAILKLFLVVWVRVMLMGERIEGVSCHEQRERGHGRRQWRRVTVIDGAPRLLGECAARWPKLARVVIVESEREVGGKRTRATRCYITSLAEEAGEMSRIVRGHWGIENRLHWVLDVAFGDDRSRVREANAAANFTILRQMAHTLLTKETSTGRGVKTRRLCAGWDNAYLLKVLGM